MYNWREYLGIVDSNIYIDGLDSKYGQRQFQLLRKVNCKTYSAYEDNIIEELT